MRIYQMVEDGMQVTYLHTLQKNKLWK